MIQKIKNSIIIKKFSLDFILSVSATLLSVGIMQLFLFPQMAKSLSVETYGISLTVIAIVNIITATFGSEMGYTKMLTFQKYKSRNLKGDFNLILIGVSIISSIIFIIYNHYVLKLYSFQMYLIILLIILTLMKAYYATAFRLNINYYSILLTNVYSGLGFVIGVIFIMRGVNWIFPFILAEILSLTFIFRKSDLWKEPFKVTDLFKSSIKIYFFLLISAFLNNLLLYMDRLIIHPMLGLEAVSIYTTAALVGKSLALIMLPISGVFLSYLIGDKLKLTFKKYVLINTVIVMICISFVLGTVIFGDVITGFLYPTLIGLAEPYLILANIGAVISIVPIISAVIVLKEAPIYWQLIISSIGIIMYVIISYYMVNNFGLYGFCWAVIITNTLRAILVITLGAYYVKKG